MWCYRRLLKINWTEKKSSEVAARVGGDCLLRKLGQRRMQYASHVLRGNGSLLHNLALEGTIEGTRTRERPWIKRTNDLLKWSRASSFNNLKTQPKMDGRGGRSWGPTIGSRIAHAIYILWIPVLQKSYQHMDQDLLALACLLESKGS